MKRALVIAVTLVLAGCGGKQPTPADFIGYSPAVVVLRDLPPQVRSFIEQKEQLALTLAKKLGVEPDRATLEYFRLARKGEYRAASRIYQDLRERGGKVESPKHDPDLRLPLWDALLEVQLTLDAYAAGAGRFATAYGEGVVQSIPRGSIYLGGTDPGRGLAAAFAKPSAEGDLFFIVAQNQLVDGQHRAYLDASFGDKAYMPSDEDSQRCFATYLDDVKRRYDHDQKSPGGPRQLKPGEHVTMLEGKPQVSGQVTVMAINGLLAKVIFDRNPDREFYVEESFPLDWMYPHLTPHGLIMKINREPLSALPMEVVTKDHDFWTQRQTEFIGRWLTPDTSVKAICDFVEKVFLRKDLVDFKGDPEFVRNWYATAAYSKLRASQGGLYAWRVANAQTTEDQQRMIKEADFAFRQSFAFCPSSAEAVYRYVNLLIGLSRMDDALLIARTAAKLNPSEKHLQSIVSELDRIKKAQGTSVPPAP
ncbi:MAG TPA: hypothetical protein VGK40_12375 [Verrucomicrobiae bacterium]|jgi:hypothetical protein